METTAIVFAILLSTWLVMRYGVRRNKLLSMSGERQPEALLRARLTMLAKLCRSGTFGVGVKLEKHKVIERMMSAPPDDAMPFEKELIVYRSELNRLKRAAKRAARQSHTVLHVAGSPRVYLFCRQTVYLRQGDISRGLFERSLALFENTAPFNEREKELLPDMLSLCFYELICSRVEEAIARADGCRKGSSDGKKGIIDLDRLRDGDYACGLLSSIDEREKAEKLFADNGVDVNTVITKHRLYFAKVCALIRTAMRSVRGLGFVKETKDPAYKVSSVVIANAIFCAALVLLALPFIFLLPVDLVALYPIACIVAYVLLRTFAPKCVDMPFFSRIHLKEKTEGNDGTIEEPEADEPICFGGGVDFVSRTVRGSKTGLYADDRGVVTLERLDVHSVPDRLELFVDVEGERLRLGNCDGALYAHKAVYRGAGEKAEFSAEFIAPVDGSGCCCDVNIVNRSPETIRVCLTPAALPMAYVGGEKFGVVPLKGGKALISGGSIRVLSSGDGVEATGGKASTLTSDEVLEIEGFGKRKVMLAYAYADGSAEAERALDFLRDDGYFRYAEECARAYCRGRGLDRRGNFIYPATVIREKPSPPPPLREEEYVLPAPFGGFIEGGVVLEDDCSIENMLVGDGVLAKCTFRGVESISFADCGELFPPSSALESRGVTVAADDEGHIVTVVGGNQQGKAVRRTRFFADSAQYMVSHNGAVYTLTCRMCEDNSVIFFLLEIENMSERDKNIDALFSLPVCADMVVRSCDDGVQATRGESGIRLSSPSNCEKCLYSEGYLVRGRVEKARDFRSGGNTPAPTLSVKLDVPAGERASATFFVYALKDFENFEHLTDIKAVTLDEKRPVRLDGRLGIRHTFDGALAEVRKIKHIDRNKLTAFEIAQALSALKYYDVKAVRSILKELLARQKGNGSVGDSLDSLCAAHAVAEYVSFEGDVLFLRKTVGYLRRTVLEAGMSALRYAAGNWRLIDDPSRDLYFCKMMTETLKFYAPLDQGRIGQEKFARALGFFSGRAEYAAGRLSNRRLKYADDVDALIGVSALYAAGKPNGAYAALVAIDPALSLSRGENDERKRRAPCCFADKNPCTAAALYYTTVAERLLGIKVSGSGVTFDPAPPDVLPLFGFELSVKGGTMKVTVDGRSGRGEWKTRSRRTEYSSAVPVPLDTAAVELLGAGDRAV